MFESWKKGYRDLVTRFSPPPSESLFYEKGTLTPEEFVEACDQLIEVNPIWRWGRAKTAKGRLEYFPEDKQYIMADIISRQRNCKMTEEAVEQEEAMVKIEVKEQETKEEIRYYQAYITYDLYYHTPRFWLGGSDENGNPLSKEQIFEEIATEYINKTATQEKCLQLDKNLVFIHPCRHAEVVRTLVNQAVNNGKNITVKEYLFIFLKFITSVMPGLELDFTMDIELQKFIKIKF